jgi:type IV secretory pathway protease TraF
MESRSLEGSALAQGRSFCRRELTITADGMTMGAARERQRRGRVVPVWQGCSALRQGEVFPMNWGEPASLDSR